MSSAEIIPISTALNYLLDVSRWSTSSLILME
jgi:hypothetical protein